MAAFLIAVAIYKLFLLYGMGFSVMQGLEEHADNQSDSVTFSSGHGVKKLDGLIASILVFVQIASPIPLLGWEPQSVTPANAVLYSPDTKIPRTGELALRRAIPANTNMKAIQARLLALMM
ncbi:hypothetical protein CDL15_Pgr002445 [Punica granatum]|uniref:Uncharacterized protein n=1 Tax=Punica granatum TaxID=22663 RepID=A0A218XV48_PUNGR|nr:hypothetical protein CDL15_Pgr002445 [Punica granatum]